jgi:hypothetical protein
LQRPHHDRFQVIVLDQIGHAGDRQLAFDANARLRSRSLFRLRTFWTTGMRTILF